MVKDLVPRPWEKKGWWYKQKYVWRHHLPMMLFYPIMLGITPIWVAYQLYRLSDPTSKVHQYQRFKDRYVVLRHDDPEVENVIKIENPDPMFTIRFY